MEAVVSSVLIIPLTQVNYTQHIRHTERLANFLTEMNHSSGLSIVDGDSTVPVEYEHPTPGLTPWIQQGAFCASVHRAGSPNVARNGRNYGKIRRTGREENGLHRLDTAPGLRQPIRPDRDEPQPTIYQRCSPGFIKGLTSGSLQRVEHSSHVTERHCS